MRLFERADESCRCTRGADGDADVGERAADVALGAVRRRFAEDARRIGREAAEGVRAAVCRRVGAGRLARTPDVDA